MPHYLLTVFIMALTVLSFYPRSVCAGVTTVLHESRIQACAVRVEHDAVAGEQGVIVVRLLEQQEGDCRLSSSQLAHTIGQGIEQFRSQGQLAAFESIFIGRIYRYPWLSAYLLDAAAKDKGWKRQAGKPLAGSANHYVNTVLFSGPLLAPVMKALDHDQYRLTGVSCEKVLLNDRRLPFDAMCWLRTQHYNTGSASRPQ